VGVEPESRGRNRMQPSCCRPAFGPQRAPRREILLARGDAGSGKANWVPPPVGPGRSLAVHAGGRADAEILDPMSRHDGIDDPRQTRRRPLARPGQPSNGQSPAASLSDTQVDPSSEIAACSSNVTTVDSCGLDCRPAPTATQRLELAARTPHEIAMRGIDYLAAMMIEQERRRARQPENACPFAGPIRVRPSAMPWTLEDPLDGRYDPPRCSRSREMTTFGPGRPGAWP